MESNKSSHEKEQKRRAEAGEAILAERKPTRAAKAAPYIQSETSKYRMSLKATFRLACANLQGNKTRREKGTHCRLCGMQT